MKSQMCNHWGEFLKLIKDENKEAMDSEESQNYMGALRGRGG